MPASEVFIDHIKMPKINDRAQNAKWNLWSSDGIPEDTILSKIEQKLPFDSGDAVIKYIPTEEHNVLVIATERKKIDRHLAIYQEANLAVKSIAVWPIAMINSYVSFFGRRKSDVDVVVMLLDIQANCTNVVICRHKNPLFARSIPIGLKQLEKVRVSPGGVSETESIPEGDKKLSGPQPDEMMTRLILDLTACRRNFASMYRKAQIERSIFLSGQSIDRNICSTIAKALEMPAHMGDCLAAVKMPAHYSDLGIDRRGCRVDWANAFGLSLQS